MALSPRDRALGMDRPITRRDFLDGIALALGGAALGPLAGALGPGRAEAAGMPYPPAAAGLVGQTDAAQAVMHGMRDGTFRIDPAAVEDGGEHYDLVVIGAGISGLAAAFHWRQRVPGARVLLIDPLDDFGGHAKRNEFTLPDGRVIIGYGGSQSLQTPSYFSPAVNALLADLGIEPARFEQFYDHDWAERRGLASAVFFDAARWGTDRLVIRRGKAADWVPQTPLNPKAQRDLIELIDAPRDYLPGLTPAERVERLAAISYARFLTEICGYDPELVDYFQTSTTGYFGVGIDACSALDARANWNPGFGGMDLGEGVPKWNSPSGRLVLTDPDDYIYHFPDGNAGVARALVRALIPEALGGATMEDLVTRRVDYAALDRPGAEVRLRLNATAVRVAHDGPPEGAGRVLVTYAQGGRLARVSAGHAILACWHRVIPYLTDEIGPEQVAALNDQQKVPLLYTNVLLANWRPFEALKIDGVRARGNFWHGFEIDFPVSMGAYRFAETPDDPVVLHFSKVMAKPGLPPREQALEGKRALVALSFEELERSLRDLLARALAGTGFDPARDILGITVNRWSHGYAYEYMWPWDPYWPDGPLPVEAARRPWGRVAIANSDSGAYAYAHSAIDQAVRAVRDLLGTPEGAPAHADFPGPPRALLGL